MLKAKPVSIVAEREKMPFEVTPFILYLSRASGALGSRAQHAGRHPTQSKSRCRTHRNRRYRR